MKDQSAMTVMHMINRSVKAEGTLRSYQHKTAMACAMHANEHSDYNYVAVYLTKLGHKMPSKAEQLAVWFGTWFPMSITGKDNTYTVKALKKKGDTYDYHLLADSWQWTEADEKPFWHKLVKASAPKEAKGIEALRDELAKFGSDKAYNSGKVTAEAAKLANEFADKINAMIAAKARKAADDAATIAAAHARNDMLEDKLAEMEAKLAKMQGSKPKAA